MYCIHMESTLYYSKSPWWGDLLVSVSASHAVGCGFAYRPGHTKDHHKNSTNRLHALHAGLA